MAKPTVWGLLLAVLALAAAAVEAGSRKGLAADRLDSGLYVQCNSRDPACLQARWWRCACACTGSAASTAYWPASTPALGPQVHAAWLLARCRTAWMFLVFGVWRRRHSLTAAIHLAANSWWCPPMW